MTLPRFPNEASPAPGLVCSRWLGSRHCGKPAVVHVAWDEQLNNSLVCVEHDAELGTRWDYHDKHPYNPVCSIPGAHWYFGDPSHCDVDDLPVTEARTASELVAS